MTDTPYPVIDPGELSTWEFLARGTRIAVIATDALGIVRLWSKDAETLYGWTSHEALGAPIHSLTVGPTRVDLAQEIMACVLDGSAWEREFTALNKKGTPIDVHGMDLPLFDAAGTIAGIVGLSHDSTDADAAVHLERMRGVSSWMETRRAGERRRIAQRLHDDLGQIVTALRTEIARGHDFATATAPNAPELDEQFAHMNTLVEACLDAVHHVCDDLDSRPLSISELLDQIAQLEAEFSQRTGMSVTVQADRRRLMAPLSGPVRLGAVEALWCVVRESFTNAERHSGASRVDIDLDRDGDTLIGRVRDDGCGFIDSVDRPRSGRGLAAMSERVGPLGGTVDIKSSPGAGTLIDVRVPLSIR